MNKKEINKLIEKRIKSCYRDLLFSRKCNYINKRFIEGFRNRLDELLLLWGLINDMSFIKCCEDLGIKYEEVNVK